MWMALLNLENTYGTVEKLQDTLKRASNACDHKALHQRVATMYDTSGKQKVRPMSEIVVFVVSYFLQCFWIFC